jgi:hypothetical protein
MTDFFKYYETLPLKERQVFRKRIIEFCMIEPPTWYSWMRRRIIPKGYQKLIAIEMGLSREELFPKGE